MDPQETHTGKLLLQRIAEGDEQSFRQLYDQYFNPVYSTALAFTQSSQLAMEVVQETFLRVWKNREKLPEVGNIAGFIFVIGRNRIKSILSAQHKISSVESLLNTSSAEDHQSPEQAAIVKQFNEEVHKAIGRLPGQQAQAFKLSRFEHLSYQEIAERMGISTATVRNHLVKALNFMRTHFEARHKDLLVLFLLMTENNM